MNENNYLGKIIGNYRIVSEIDSGAFGRVYLAQHTFLKNRAVAIKLLHATHLGSAEERENFLREAQFLEALKHPYILPVLDVGIDDGFPYLVAEFAPDGSLRDHIKRNAPHPLPMQEALTILTQVGEALYFAHQQHIIHRDIKPENILFNARREALLADFGVATMMETASIKYATIIGTPSYMAPEQFQNSISKESDQYSLGCIAYELFTGRRPFTANDFFAMGFKHLNEQPIAPTQLNMQLPPYIEQAIFKAMSKQRFERFPDIKAFIRALHVPTTSQANLPRVMPSSTDSTHHLSQVPTLDSSKQFSYARPADALEQETLLTKPRAAEENQDLISTKLYQETWGTWAPSNQDPITPLPAFGEETIPGFRNVTGKPTLPINPPFSAPADKRISGEIPKVYNQGPITPFPLTEQEVPTYIHERRGDVHSLLNPSSPMPTVSAPERWLYPEEKQPRKRKWFFIAAISLAILTILLSSMLGLLVTLFSPTLSFTGSSNVAPGGTLHLHGSGFLPGTTVSLSLDDGLPLSYVGRDAQGKAWYTGVAGATTLQASLLWQEQAASNSSIAVDGAGNFDTTIWVNPRWPVGVHSIHATASISLWSTQKDFTIIPQTAKLAVNTHVLDFGKVGMGVQPILSIAVSNAGGERLVWSADLVGTNWLRLQKNTGTIEPGMTPQTINVTADTRSLQQKAYSALLKINSNGGDAQVTVKIQVGPPVKGAKLNVSPTTLNFGQLLVDQQATQVVTVGNVGSQDLTWNADTGGTSWLSLSTSSGAIKSSGLPEAIYITANTTGLTPNNYQATLNVKSNGGTVHVGMTLVVTGPTPPTPTFGPTNTPTPRPTRTPDPTATPTNTPIPPPSPTITPDPTPPPPSETLTVDFTNPSGSTTVNSYSGTINIQVCGIGQAWNVHGESDAFYVFTDGMGTPNPNPWHSSQNLDWVLNINGQNTLNFINPTPGYNSSGNHTYNFTITAPGGQINFVVGDQVFSDNSGYYYIGINTTNPNCY